MKNSQKGFVVPLLLAIIAVLVVGGGVYVYKNKTDVAPLKNQVEQQTNTQISDSNLDFKNYANAKLGYSISYPSSYHISSENNILNYDEKDFKRGNTKGVKIQIQQATAFAFDVDVELGRQKFISSLNTFINNKATESEETQIEPFYLNAIKYKNRVVIGPGGSFDVYFAFPDDSSHVAISGSNSGMYFRILVWGAENDKENVNKILSTFKFTK